jgi:hypothetical protein
MGFWSGLRHVCKVSKWKIEYRIGIHFCDLVYVLNEQVICDVDLNVMIENENTGFKTQDAQKTSTSVVSVYGDMIEFTKRLTDSCLLK